MEAEDIPINIAEMEMFRDLQRDKTKNHMDFYLFSKDLLEVLDAFLQNNPEMKTLFVLRNNLSQVVSNYEFLKKEEKSAESFMNAKMEKFYKSQQ